MAIKADFTLWQWDTNRSVTIDSGDRVHFAHEGDETAYVIVPEETDGVLTAAIPDELLQSATPIMAFAASGGNTTDSTYLSVTARPRPNDYAYTPTDKQTISELDAWMREQFAALEADAEAVITQVSESASAAEQAVTNAESALARANEAAASANAAATAAETVIAGNVLKGTLGPAEVLTTDDAWAAKPLGLKVHGRTRQNLWVNPSGTRNGITATPNADGSVYVSGASEGNPNAQIINTSYVLKPNTQYTFSIDTALPSGSSFYIVERNSAGTWLNERYSTVAGTTFTTSSDISYATLGISASNGTVLNGTYRVMLNEGSTAQPWCPPGLNSVGDDGNVKVVTAGKNLLKFQDNLQPLTLNGLTFTPNEDGTITVNGTATSNDTDYYIVGVSWGGRADASLPASDLVFSSNGRAKIYGYDSDGASVISVIINNGQMQIAASKAQACDKMVVYLSYAAGAGESNKRVYVQLELGSTATDYEPPNVTATPIPLDGNELCSLPDGTRDVLDVMTGEIEKNAILFEPDGSENWSFTGAYASTGGGFYYINRDIDASESVSINSSNSLSDMFSVASLGGTTDSSGIVGYGNGTYNFRIRPYDESVQDASSLERFKQWLSENRPKFVLPLKTPDAVLITPSSLPSLPSPNITAYADPDVTADVELEYVRDVNIAYSKLEQAITATAAGI